MLNIVDELCTGCSACASICPKHAIKMKINEEGFFIPSIDDKICVKCGICKKTCPVETPIFKESESTHFFLAQHPSKNIRRKSASGGAFSLIAEYVLSNNGVVFGAAYDEKFNVHHKYIEHIDELDLLRQSKYVQSDVGSSFKEVKRFLDQNRTVLFSGTPCQISGLKKYLGNIEQDNLWLIDIACHGVGSPKFFRQYKSLIEEKYESTIKRINMRSKKFGYSSSAMEIEFTNGRKIIKGGRVDIFLNAFYSNYILKKSCAGCKFKTLKRFSDFTLYDCWHLYKVNPNLDDNIGTTGIVVHSEKAYQLMQYYQKKKFVFENTKDLFMLDSGMILGSVKHQDKRDKFLAIPENDYKKLNHLFKVPLKEFVKETLKPLLFKTGFLKIFNNRKLER